MEFDEKGSSSLAHPYCLSLEEHKVHINGDRDINVKATKMIGKHSTHWYGYDLDKEGKEKSDETKVVEIQNYKKLFIL